MDLYEAIGRRRSIRQYKQTPIPPDALGRILEAGRLAPSWKNRQCWRTILVTDPTTLRSLGALIDNPSAACYESAPCALVLCADPTDSGSTGGKDYYLVDCGICMAHMALAATQEGLGSCWVGYFPENPVRGLLGIPRDTKVVAITPLGYADEAPGPRSRKALSETVFTNAWNPGQCR